MKILSAEVTNFGSYKHLEFKFEDQGLTLISGPTGAGKSTLCDVVPWILYGKTAKNGNVDDVITWNSNGITKGSLTLNLDNKVLTVVRTRNPNDLYILDNKELRGKDLADTQKRIDDILGMNADLYLTASYLHEFSHTSTFFNTTAKIRRQLTEQLVDLEMVKKLSEDSNEYRKAIKKEKDGLIQQIQLKQKLLEDRNRSLDKERDHIYQWEYNQHKKIKDVEKKHKTFEEAKEERVYNKAEEWFKYKQRTEDQLKEMENKILSKDYFIQELDKIDTRLKECKDDVCKECGNIKDTHTKMIIEKDRYTLKNKEIENSNMERAIKIISKELNRNKKLYEDNYDEIHKEKNLYAEQLEQLKKQECPFIERETSLKIERSGLIEDVKKLENDIQDFKREESDLELLQAVLNEFRSLLISNSVRELESSTNKALNDHFDGELKVKFIQEADDKLDIEIYKDDNKAVYPQLSKGQRQLLKLTFGVSVMKFVALHNSVNIPILFLDEPSDGLSEDFKLKSFRLLQELSQNYESVLVVEHNEALKSQFTNRYDIRLDNGISSVENT